MRVQLNPQTVVESVEDVDTIPILGLIPWIPQSVYASFYPPSAVHLVQNSCGIAYQCLASNLMNCFPNLKSLLVTATGPQKTASWMLMNLVYYLACKDQKILLVDADFQWPSVHHAFDIAINQTMGFGDVLAKISAAADPSPEDSVAQCLMENIVPIHDIPNLYVMHNAVMVQPGLGLPGYDTAFNQFLTTITRHFDWVLFDTSPLEEQSPFLWEIGQCLEGLLVLQDKNLTPQRWQHLRALLEINGLSVIGSVKRGGEYFELQGLPVI